LEDTFIGALTGERERIASRDLGVRLGRGLVRPPEVREGLEVVQQAGIVGFVVPDCQPRDRRQAERRAAGGVGQLENEVALALIFRVVNCLHGERLNGDVGREGERAGDGRDVVAVGDGRADRRLIVDGDDFGHGLAELDGDGGERALGHREADAAERNGERLDGRDAVYHRVVDVVRLRRGGRDRAERPAVDLGQAEAVVGRAVADLLAVEVDEGELDLPPAAEVVDHVDRPALGVVRRGAGVAIVEHVDEEGRAAVIAVEPERKPLVSAPVLRDPGVEGRVLEVVDKAGVRDDIDVHLENVVGVSQARNRGRRRTSGGNVD
jgi:hypothetical protein